MQNNYLCVKADMDRPRNIFNFGGCRETGSRFAKMSISCPTFLVYPFPLSKSVVKIVYPIPVRVKV